MPGAPVVAFRGVDFAYEDGEDVLHEIDFAVDARREDRPGGGVRWRQVHHREPAAGPLRAAPRQHRGGGSPERGSAAGPAALPHRRGLPGRLPVLRQHPREHRLRPPRGERGGGGRRGPPRERRHLHPPLPGRLRAGDRRARAQALRRAAPADRGGPRDAQGRPRAGARRGHLRPGHQGRDPGAEGAGPADDRAYLTDHRPPPLHDRRGGQDHHAQRRAVSTRSAPRPSSRTPAGSTPSCWICRAPGTRRSSRSSTSPAEGREARRTIWSRSCGPARAQP